MSDALATRLCSLFFGPGGEAASVAWTELVFARWGVAVVCGEAATRAPFVVRRDSSGGTEITAQGFALELQPSCVPFVPCDEQFPLRDCRVVVRDVRLCMRLDADLVLQVVIAHAHWAMPHGAVGDLRVSLGDCHATLVHASTAQPLLTLSPVASVGAGDDENGDNYALVSFTRGSVVLVLDAVAATPSPGTDTLRVLSALIRARLPCKPRSDRLAPVMDNFSWLLDGDDNSDGDVPQELSPSSSSLQSSSFSSSERENDSNESEDSECDSDDSMQSAVDMTRAFELPDVALFAKRFVWNGAGEDRVTLECHNCHATLTLTEDRDEELFALPHVSCRAERLWMRQHGEDVVATVVPEEWRVLAGALASPPSSPAAGAGAGVVFEVSWSEQSVLVSADLRGTPLVCTASGVALLGTLARAVLSPPDESAAMVQTRLSASWALHVCGNEPPLAVVATDVSGEGQAGTILLHIGKATVGTLVAHRTEVEYTWRTTIDDSNSDDINSGVRAYEDFVTMPQITGRTPSLHGARVVVPDEPERQRPLSREDLSKYVATATAHADQRLRTSVQRLEGTISAPFVQELRHAAEDLLRALPQDILGVHGIDEGVLDVTALFGESPRVMLSFVDGVGVVAPGGRERAVACRQFRVAAQPDFVLFDSLPTSTSQDILGFCAMSENEGAPWNVSVGCAVLHWHEDYAALWSRMMALLHGVPQIALESVSVQVTFKQIAPVFVVVVDAGCVLANEDVWRLVLSGVHLHIVDGTHHLIPNDVRHFASPSSFWIACNAIEAATLDYVAGTVAHTDASTLIDVSDMNGVHLHLCCDTGALLVSVLVRLWARTDKDPRPSSPDQVHWSVPEMALNGQVPSEEQHDQAEEAQEVPQEAIATTEERERQSLSSSLSSVNGGGLVFRLDGTSSQLFADDSEVESNEPEQIIPETVKWHTEDREIPVVDEYAPEQDEDVLEALRALEGVRFRLSVARVDAVTVHLYDGYDWFILDDSRNDTAPREEQTSFWMQHVVGDAGGGTAVCAPHTTDTCAECVLRGVRLCAVREADLSVTRVVVRAESLLALCSVKDHIRAVPVVELDRESSAWFLMPHAGKDAQTVALQAVYEGCWLERRVALWVQPLHVMMDSYVSHFVDAYFAAGEQLYRGSLPTREVVRHSVPFGAAVVAPVTVRLTYHPDLTAGSVTHSLANGVASLISTENSVLALPRVVLAHSPDCTTLGRVLAGVFRAWAQMSYFAIAQCVVATSTHPVLSIVRIARDTAGLLAAPAQHALGAAPTVRGVPESLGQTVAARRSALVATLVHEACSLGRGVWSTATSLYHSIRDNTRAETPNISNNKSNDEDNEDVPVPVPSSPDVHANTVMSNNMTPGTYEPWTFRHLFSACPDSPGE